MSDKLQFVECMSDKLQFVVVSIQRSWNLLRSLIIQHDKLKFIGHRKWQKSGIVVEWWNPSWDANARTMLMLLIARIGLFITRKNLGSMAFPFTMVARRIRWLTIVRGVEPGCRRRELKNSRKVSRSLRFLSVLCGYESSPAFINRWDAENTEEAQRRN